MHALLVQQGLFKKLKGVDNLHKEMNDEEKKILWMGTYCYSTLFVWLGYEKGYWGDYNYWIMEKVPNSLHNQILDKSIISEALIVYSLDERSYTH